MGFTAQWLIQDGLISRSLTQLDLPSSLFQEGHMHRFQGLGYGHSFGERGTIQPSIPSLKH